MSVIAPVGHGPLKMSIPFNQSPPLNHRHAFERDIVFSQSSGSIEDLEINGQQHQVLPEQGGLFGIALRPRQEHYHNFLYEYSSAPTLYEDNYKIAHSLSAKDNLRQHFGWRVTPGWYEENAGGAKVLPLKHGTDYTESSSGSTANLTDNQKAQQKGAKWAYKLQPVPIHSFGMNSSGIAVSDDKVAKLVPWQTQLQGSDNGPTGIGVHWGLQKLINIPYGLGYYLDFYLNKDIDPPTSDAKILKSDRSDYKDVPNLFYNDFEAAFKANSSTAINNSDVFTGSSADDKNSSFYFINKSYLVIQITGNATVGNCFFLVITSESHPKLFQCTISARGADGAMSAGKVRLLSEYNPSAGDGPAVASGLKMLRGDQGHLRLQIRQLGRHILIENNVFSAPWVIPLSAYTPNPITPATVSSTPDADLDISGTVRINQIGGKLSVFGGNMSCGVSFCHLNYYENSEMTLKDTKVWGSGRNFTSSLYSAGASKMDTVLKTSGRYYANLAQTMIDDAGLVDASNRPDQKFHGFNGAVMSNSKIQISDDASSSSGNYTILKTKINLTAGKAQSTAGGGFEYGFCITPVLQFCRQTAPMATMTVSTSTVNIEDIVETIEITKEAQDYHAVSTSGSMLINILYPSHNATARSAVINSIGKARYLSIDASHFGCAAEQFQAHRSGGAPGGSVVTGSGGDRTLFTGIAYNPTISEEAGKRYIKLELKDYWAILESKLIINSPYFDGALDTDVVDYFLDYTGVKDTFRRVQANSTDAMPISFSFNQPLAKFQDRKTVADSIKELAKKYSKYAFFDHNGVFCYQPMPTVLLSGAGGPPGTKFYFYSSHFGRNTNVIPIGPFYTDSAATALTTTTSVPSHNSQVAYEVKTTQWNNKDIFNKLMILSVDARSRGYIVVSDTNYDSLTDSNSLGFLGYERTFIQDEAAFGDIDRARKVLRYYTRMFKPVYIMNWKCIGGNLGVDIFDIVSVDGALVVVTKISHTMDAKKNLWETEYTGEWIFPPLSTGNASVEAG